MRKFFKINDQFVGSHFEVIYRNETLETSEFVPIAEEETDSFKRFKQKCSKLVNMLKDSSLKQQLAIILTSSHSL